jgi:hypothetical protein
MLIAVEDCGLLGRRGHALVFNRGWVDVAVVDCQTPGHKPLSELGIVADVNDPVLNQTGNMAANHQNGKYNSIYDGTGLFPFTYRLLQGSGQAEEKQYDPYRWKVMLESVGWIHPSGGLGAFLSQRRWGVEIEGDMYTFGLK